MGWIQIKFVLGPGTSLSDAERPIPPPHCSLLISPKL